MDFSKMDIKNFIIGIAVSVLGLIIAIFPATSIKVVVILMGAIAVASGIYNLYKVYKLSNNEEFKKIVLIKSIVSIFIGLLAIILPFAFIKVIETLVKIILYVEAIYLLLSAMAEFLMISKLKDEGISFKNLRIETVGSIVAAIILFLLAANFATTVVRIIGIALLTAGIAYSLYYYFHKPIIVEAENVRDADDSESEKV